MPLSLKLEEHPSLYWLKLDLKAPKEPCLPETLPGLKYHLGVQRFSQLKSGDIQEELTPLGILTDLNIAED